MRSAFLAALLVAIALPSGALAQTPGDEQYTDPFGGSQDESSGGQPDADEEASPPEATPAPAAPETSAPPAAEPEAATSQASKELPYSGVDAGLLAVGGVTLVVGGVVLRLRLRAT